MVVHRILARAWLAEPGTELDGARQRATAGDDDWRQWVEEFDRGEATLIDMSVRIEVELDDGSRHAVEEENHQIWMPLGQQPPAVAAQVAEISGKDFEELTRRLRALGAPIEVDELERMHVTVELGEDLRAASAARLVRRIRPLTRDARPGVETERAE